MKTLTNLFFGRRIRKEINSLIVFHAKKRTYFGRGVSYEKMRYHNSEINRLMKKASDLEAKLL